MLHWSHRKKDSSNPLPAACPPRKHQSNQRGKCIMFLGVVGFLMVVIIVAALIRGKSNPVPLFVMVPVIAALICGFTPSSRH